MPSPVSPYGITKLACEHLSRAFARSFGADAVVLRYFTVYGPRQRPDMAFARIVRSLLTETSFELFGDGRQARSFTYVADAVAATIAAMENGLAGAVYNVGGRDPVSLNDAISLLEQASGRKLRLVRSAPALGDVSRTSADTSRIEAEVGWEPLVALEHGLRAQWEWALDEDRAAGRER